MNLPYWHRKETFKSGPLNLPQHSQAGLVAFLIETDDTQESIRIPWGDRIPRPPSQPPNVREFVDYLFTCCFIHLQPNKDKNHVFGWGGVQPPKIIYFF